MRKRYISGVATAFALSAAVTLFGQTPTPAGGAQAPAGGRGAGRGEGAPAGGQGAGGSGQRAGGGGRGVNLRPKALDTASDIKFEVVKDFFKLPPNVYMG